MVEADSPEPELAEPTRVDGPTLPPEDPADQTTEIAGAIDTFAMGGFYDDPVATPPVREPARASSRVAAPLSQTILPLEDDDELNDASAVYLKQDGRVYMVQDWDTMRGWIQEGRVGREDLVSEGGVRWSPIGTHPKAARTFGLLDQRAAMSDGPAADEELPVEDTSEVQLGAQPFFADDAPDDLPASMTPLDAPPAPTVSRFPSASDTRGVSTGLPALPDLSGTASERARASLSDSTEDVVHGSQQRSVDPPENLFASPLGLPEDIGDPETAPPAMLDEDDDEAEGETAPLADYSSSFPSTASLFSQPSPLEPAEVSDFGPMDAPFAPAMDVAVDPDATQPPPRRTPTPMPPPMQEVDAPDPVHTSILGPEPEGDTLPAPPEAPHDDDTGFGTDFFADGSHDLGADPGAPASAGGSGRKWALALSGIATLVLLPLLLVKGLGGEDTPIVPSGPSLSAALGDPEIEVVDPPATDVATAEPDSDPATDSATEPATDAPEPATEAPVTPAPKEPAPQPAASVNVGKEAARCWAQADSNQSSAKAAAKKALSADAAHGGANLCLGYVIATYDQNPPGAKTYLCRAVAAGGQDAVEAKGMLRDAGLSCN